MTASRAIWIAVVVLLGVVILAVLAFAVVQPEQPTVVQLRDARGRLVGTAVLSQISVPVVGGIRITVNAEGLEPGEHGIHIHETGRCDPPDFESAGSHFNPSSTQHGLENPNGPHAGDMPNLPVGADGTAVNYQTEISTSLSGGQTSLLSHPGGSALVIHADRDDQMSDPSGNSGSRVACGVIAPG